MMLHSNWLPGQTGHAAEHNEITKRLVNINEFGGVGDNANDNAAAIANGITYVVNNNSRLYFPKGKYKTSAVVDLSNQKAIELAGDGSEDRPDSAIIYTGTAPIALNMQGARGCKLNGIAIAYSNPAFTGHLIHAGGGSAYPQFYRTWLGPTGSAVNSAASLLCLDGSYGVTLRNVQFVGGQVGLIGKLINTIVGKSGFANHVTLDQCSFQYQVISCIKNAAEAWDINATFEPLSDVPFGGELGNRAYTHDPGMTANGVIFRGCWMGDAAAPGGTWITWAGDGLMITGSVFGTNANTTILKLDANGCHGISLFGNKMGQNGGVGIDFGSTTGHTDYVDLGNAWNQVTTKVNGTIPALVVSGSRGNGAALTSLLSQLSAMHLIVDSTTL